MNYRKTSEVVAYSRSKAGVLGIRNVAILNKILVFVPVDSENVMGFEADYIGIGVKTSSQSTTHANLAITIYGFF